MKLRYCWLLAAVAFGSGCGKQEKSEALQLYQALTQKQSNFTNANSMESDFVTSARAWCGGIASSGSGRGAELDQNASVASQLAKNAVAISAELSQVRQAIADLPLNADFPKSVRSALITQLTNRQRMLQEVRAMLEQSAPEFLQYKNIKGYAGDQYPGGIGKLDGVLKSYKLPEDSVGTALNSLKTKYGFSGTGV